MSGVQGVVEATLTWRCGGCDQIVEDTVQWPVGDAEDQTVVSRPHVCPDALEDGGA